MEDKYREIRIGVFGGNAKNKIDWLKHLYKFFNVFKLPIINYTL